MLYWLNGWPLSGVNIHREAFSHMPKDLGVGRVDVLTGDASLMVS